MSEGTKQIPSPIDVIITSMGRFDLLRRTLDSFFKYNTYPIANVYCYDDSGSQNRGSVYSVALDKMRVEYPRVVFLCGSERIGQIAALDLLMGYVKSEYYMTIEDDFETLQDGAIDKSLSVLKYDKSVINVWLMDKSEMNGHPITGNTFFCPNPFSYLSNNHVNNAGTWCGFSFTPSVRRLSDYNAIGNYSKHTTFNRSQPWQSEVIIGLLYRQMGYKAAILPQGYVKHIGDGRGIRG